MPEYRLKTADAWLKTAAYFTIDAAHDAAQDIADRLNRAVTVVEVEEDGRVRGRGIRGSKHPRSPAKRTRETLAVEKKQAPANVKRTKGKTPKKRALPGSKLMALNSFWGNPSPLGYPYPGEYYFTLNGKYYTSRNINEIQRRAQLASDHTGKRVEVFKEDYDEKPSVFKSVRRTGRR